MGQRPMRKISNVERNIIKKQISQLTDFETFAQKQYLRVIVGY
jgi:hypothetical protein